MTFFTFARLIFGAPLRLIFGIKRYHVKNMPKSGPVILCSNHRSNYDPVILGAALNRDLRFMAKSELFSNPFLGALIKALGAFPVRRGKNDSDAMKKAVEILETKSVLTMFPEGTRNKDGGEPLRFKSGAALLAYKTHAPVVPAAIVTRGRVRPFKRNVVVIGKPISYEELGFTDGSMENLREVSGYIHDKVYELIKEITAGARH